MFAIYGIEGRRFRDTLENLYRVRKIPAGHGIRSHPDVSGDETRVIPVPGRGGSGGAGVSREALEAYRSIRQLDRREPLIHACQLMSYPVATVQINQDIVSAWRCFDSQHYRQLPVMDPRQRIVGMLSERDLLHFLILDGQEFSYVRGKTVANTMSGEVITADPVADVRRIAQVMLAHHLSAMPIVDEQDNLVGLVSRSDILRAVTGDPPLSLWT